MPADKPMLHIPESRGRSQYEAELTSGDPERMSMALIDSSYEEEADWVQARCLEGLLSPHALVRSRAVIALQVLAAVRHEIDPLAAMPAVMPLLRDTDSHVAWLAEQLLADIKRTMGH